MSQQHKTLTALPAVDINQKYSIEEAILYERSSRAQIYKAINEGKLRVIREGRRTKIPGSELARRAQLPSAADARSNP